MVASAVNDAVQTLRIEKDILIQAPLDIAFEALLEELGPASEIPGGKPMPMVLEAWPGGRWFRDLGNKTGHFWGHVQVIKPPTLLEISGPMFMSYAGLNHLQYRLAAEGNGTKLKLVHRAIGEIAAEHRDGVDQGWSMKLNRVRELAEAAQIDLNRFITEVLHLSATFSTTLHHWEVNIMKCKIITALAVASFLTCLPFLQADDHKKHHDSPALKQFADLAGEWVGTSIHGDKKHEMKVVYKVSSGGSIVVETIDPGTDHEMITVIHPDGNSLVLTHYCMLGNQPQMKGTPKPGDNKVAFEFVKATNLKSDKDEYMRSVTFTFVDKDTVKTEWSNYADGKEAGKVHCELKRKK